MEITDTRANNSQSSNQVHNDCFLPLRLISPDLLSYTIGTVIAALLPSYTTSHTHLLRARGHANLTDEDL